MAIEFDPDKPFEKVDSFSPGQHPLRTVVKVKEPGGTVAPIQVGPAAPATPPMPEFDPDKPFEAVSTPTKRGFLDQAKELGSAAVRGLANVPTFGFGDKAGAALQAALLEASGDSSSYGENYDRALHENRQESAAAADAHPVAYYGPGMAASALVTPEVKAVQGLGLGARMANGLVNGAGQGALAGLGSDDSGDIAQKVEALKHGGEIGGALGAAAPALVHGLPKALEGMGVAQARRYLTGLSNSLSNKLALPEQAVRRALEEKIVPWFGSVAKAAERSEAASGEAGQAVGNIVEGLRNEGVEGPSKSQNIALLQKKLAALRGKAAPGVGVARSVNPEVRNAYQGALNEIEQQETPMVAQAKAASSGTVNQRAPQMAPGDKFDLVDAENIKRSQQDLVNYDQPIDSPANKANKDVAKQYREAVEGAVAQGAAQNPQNAKIQQLAQDFVPAKQRAGDLIAVRDAAKIAANKLQKNAAVGLRAGVIGSALGAPLTPVLGPMAPIAGGLAGWGIPRYMNSTFSRATYGLGSSLGKVGEYLERDPAKLGPFGAVLQRIAQQKGLKGVAAAHFVLSQTSPQYQEHVQGLDPGDNTK